MVDELDEHVADLVLARAWAVGDSAALAEFERRYMPEIEAALARFRMPADEADELKQVVRERLMVGGDGMPRLARCRGNGPLGAWVRVVAARAAIDSRRQRARRVAREQATMAELVADG